MSETVNLGLPLVQPAQAQKHVTVNEALARLDGMVQLRLATTTQTLPPAPVDGAVHAVPSGATGDWAGQDGRLALVSNGGWDFIDPVEGWQGWAADQGRVLRYLDGAWRPAPVTRGPFGAAAAFETVAFDHAVGAGTLSTTVEVIPADSMIFAVSARVVTALSGSLTSWQLGDAGQGDRYGAGMGVAVGSYATGLLGTPMSVYADTPLVLSATGGSFAGGTVRIAAQVLRLTLPQV